MKTLSPEEFTRLKKRMKTLDKINRLLMFCLGCAVLNLVLLFFGVNLFEWVSITAADAAGKAGELIESAYKEISAVLGERASS